MAITISSVATARWYAVTRSDIAGSSIRPAQGRLRYVRQRPDWLTRSCSNEESELLAEFPVYIGDENFGWNWHRERKAKNRVRRVATGLCGLCLSCSAVASPPINWGGSSSAIASARSTPLAARPVARQQYTPAPNLDLRPPGASPSAISHEGSAVRASETFPSTTHRLDLGQPDLAPDNRVQARVLPIGELNFRVMSQAEIFARRVHQEGLPIARLFQSKSASLSIGLNKRGKPGLWFTQKTH
jgi:hypothetical protein